MTSDTFRPELQGLRAVAVLLVYVFHLEAGLLSGGYVGVDAFFVLSGYLITGSLVSELARTGRIDFYAFYERRFRRLLPTAALVLLAIVLAAGILPRDRWPSIGREVIASSVYLENWFLAHHSVDYLAVDNSPGPVQHYWSLSVEEQFYFVWPLFLVCAVALLKRWTGSARRACCLAIALALLLSFGASAAAALKPKVGDYFATHLRIWELALGGLIAAIGRDGFRFASGRLAPWLQGIGLAMLLGAGVGFSSVTVFPGYAALVPAVGTGLVMMVTGVPRHPQRNVLLDNAPMRWIGDISYSFYLWHWPVIVYAKALNGGSLGWPLAVLVTLVVLALSHLTKIHVEDRFRVGHGPAAVRPARRWRTAGVVVAAIGVPILLSVSLLAFLAFDTRRLRMQVLDARDYPGGASLLASAPPPDGPYFPSASRVTLDIPDIYDGDCSLPYGASRIQPCPRGDPAGPLKVALVGDSHMAQWSPAFDVAGKRNGWTIIPLTKSSCPLVATRLRHFDAQSCAEWSESVWTRLADDPPDVIVTTL
jgi:peptidoglycan/LPS O-acetylase OafA/YrhL